MVNVPTRGSGNNPLRWSLYFDGDGCFRGWFWGHDETWDDAHSAGANALDILAESRTASRWRYALAYDAARMARLAVRASIGDFSSDPEPGRFLAMEQAFRDHAQALDNEAHDLAAFGYRVDVIIARAFARSPDARHCARVCRWLSRWARIAVELVACAESGGPVPESDVSPAYATALDLSAELLAVSSYKAAAGDISAAGDDSWAEDPSAGIVAAIAAMLVRELRRDTPFVGVELPAWALEAPVSPLATFDDVVARLRLLPGDDAPGAALLLFALVHGFGPGFGDDPTETTWAHWYTNAMERCRAAERKRRGPRGDGTVRAARVAVAALGFDADAVAAGFYKRASRARPATQRAERGRNAKARGREKT